jgi:flagellin
MPQTIATNALSLAAQRNLNISQRSLTTTIERLSSGLRINSAADDAAGLAIAERIQTQVKGMNVAIRNANDAISLMQVAEGSAQQIGENLQRMRELAVQAANGTYNSGDRGKLEDEFFALSSEISRLSRATKFANVNLLDSTATTFTFQVGAGTTADNQITMSTVDMQASATEMAVDSSVVALQSSTNGAALAAIAALDCAINTVTTTRSKFGAALNRSSAVISSLQIAVEKQAAARGRIMDADFAAETAELTRTQILQQAGTAMLAQANAAPQNVLSLLR